MKTIATSASQTIELKATAATTSKQSALRLETALCYVFAAGVIITFAFAVAGVVFLYLSQGHIDLLKERAAFVHQQSFFTMLFSLVRGINMPTGSLLFANLGMVSLVLTPLLAVAVSCVYFALKKNTKYVGITLIVLTILITSLALH